MSYFKNLFILRYIRTLLFFSKGCLVHPTVKFIGYGKNILFLKGVRVGSFSAFSIGRSIDFISIGCSSVIANNVSLEARGDIYIGSSTSIHAYSSINGSVTIGDDCLLAPNIFISSGTHIYDLNPMMTIRSQDDIFTTNINHEVNRVVIQNDCWIGTNCVLMPGAVLGRGCVVGANSVVKNVFPPYSVLGGSPAKILKKRMEWKPRENIIFNNMAHLPYLLLGSIIELDGVKCLRLTQHSKNLVALLTQSNNFTVSIDYKTCGDQELCINGRKFILNGSNKISNFKYFESECSDEVFYMDISASNDFYIYSISIL